MNSGDLLYIDPYARLTRPLEERFPGRRVKGSAEALKLLKENGFSAVFICNPKLEPERLIPALLRKNPTLTIVLFTEKDEPVGDFVQILVDRVVNLPVSKEDIERLESLFRIKSLLRSCNLVGRSDAIKAVGELIFRLASTDVSVLLVGESGVGKELVARALHKYSKRSSARFVPVNSGAIPATLIESELFGYERGAFTGAFRRKIGYFERASGGTIFLDEIGELSLTLQVKLLRVLESGELYRVGGSEPVKIDTRVIAATNKDLKGAVNEGKFREDLYFRLAGATIYIPPLRERREDIPALIYKFTEEISEREGREFGGLGEDAVRAMMDYFWPGNVRELKNLLEKGLLIAGERVIHADDLRPYFEEHAAFGRALPAVYDSSSPVRFIVEKLEAISHQLAELQKSISNMERGGELELRQREAEAIRNALRKTGGNKRQAALILGISPKTLYRKMRRYEIPLHYGR